MITPLPIQVLVHMPSSKSKQSALSIQNHAWIAILNTWVSLSTAFVPAKSIVGRRNFGRNRPPLLDCRH